MALPITPSTFTFSPNTFDPKNRIPHDRTPPKPVSVEVKEALCLAIVRLANNCDGAKSDDGVGFNKGDVNWGHSLSFAIVNSTVLPDNSQARYMMKRLRKYYKQLPDILAVTIWGDK